MGLKYIDVLDEYVPRKLQTTSWYKLMRLLWYYDEGSFMSLCLNVGCNDQASVKFLQ